MRFIIMATLFSLLSSGCQTDNPSFARGKAAKTQQIQIGPLVREILEAQGRKDYARAITLANDGLALPGLKPSEVVTLMEFKANNYYLSGDKASAAGVWREYIALPQIRIDQKMEPLWGLMDEAMARGDLDAAARYGEDYMVVMSHETTPPARAQDYDRLAGIYDQLGRTDRAAFWRNQRP